MKAFALPLMALLVTGPAHAATATDAAYGEAFVAAFAEACVPGRLGFETTKAAALEAGWIETQADANPELANVMARSEKEVADPEIADMNPTFDYALYTRAVADLPHYLVVSLGTFDMAEPDAAERDIWAYTGCYLYNFDAEAPIDPAPVGELTGKPVAAEIDQDGLVAYTFGPPCPMPRTGDTYLTFVADESPAETDTGFSGLMIKFDTSVPDPGEEVPETYC